MNRRMVYQVMNNDWQPVPAKPFDDIGAAERYIKALLETYKGPFYVIELIVVQT